MVDPTNPADPVELLTAPGPRELLYYLAKHPGSYYHEVCLAVSTADSSLDKDLRALEDAGIIKAHFAAGPGDHAARLPRLSVNIQRVDLVLRDLRRRLVGSNYATQQLPGHLWLW